MKTFSLWLREQGGAIFWASIPKQSVEPARKRGHDSHQPTHHVCHFVPVVPSCLCSQCHFDIQRKCPLGRSLKMMPLNASAGSNRLFLTCSHKNVCPLSVYNKSVLICYLENITQQENVMSIEVNNASVFQRKRSAFCIYLQILLFLLIDRSYWPWDSSVSGFIGRLNEVLVWERKHVIQMTMSLECNRKG